MPRRIHQLDWTALGIVGILVFAGPSFAQITPGPPRFSSLPGMAPATQPQAESTPSNFLTAVSFIDSAKPRSMVRIRLENGFNNVRPDRAEFIFPKSGFPLPETKVSSLDLYSYVEYAWTPWISTFMDTPVKWVNPEVNSNLFGYGDLNFGFKSSIYNTELLLATLQVRVTAPTANQQILGTQHWSLEPALLANFQVLPNLALEGEVRYTISGRRSGFAGDVLRYGLGISYGQPSTNQISIIPVAEFVGWTVMGGQATAVDSPPLFVLENGKTTILNGNLGLRMGLGSNADLYGGYSRAITGSSWFRDMFRVELRIFY